jgi:hypothetical protein
LHNIGLFSSLYTVYERGFLQLGENTTQAI